MYIGTHREGVETREERSTLQYLLAAYIGIFRLYESRLMPALGEARGKVAKFNNLSSFVSPRRIGDKPRCRWCAGLAIHDAVVACLRK